MGHKTEFTQAQIINRRHEPTTTFTICFFFFQNRLFSTRCGSCLASFGPNEYVMRARGGMVFHPSCFRCHTCRRLLVPGDEFSMRESRIFCKDDAIVVGEEEEELDAEQEDNNNNNNEDDDDESNIKGGSSISDGDDVGKFYFLKLRHIATSHILFTSFGDLKILIYFKTIYFFLYRTYTTVKYPKQHHLSI